MFDGKQAGPQGLKKKPNYNQSVCKKQHKKGKKDKLIIFKHNFGRAELVFWKKE